MKDASSKIHQRNVVCAAAKAEDKDLHLLLELIQPESKAGGGRFVDYSNNLKSSYLAGVLRCLPLIVIEVSGDRDHSLLDRPSHEGLGITLDLLKYKRRNLLRRVFFSIDRNLVLRAHLPLDLKHSSFRVYGSLSFCWLANKQLSVFCERNDGREHLSCHRRPFRAGNDGRSASLHNGCRRVGGAKVDSQYLLLNRLS